MLLQTNSYVVPKEKRSEHSRLVRRFRQVLARLGCDHFEVFEQVGANWGAGETTGRFVQIMRFRDRRHQQQVQGGERTDPAAQQLIQEFCALINFPYQQQQGLFAVGFYTSALPISPTRAPGAPPPERAANAAASDSGLGSLEGVAVEGIPDDMPPTGSATTVNGVHSGADYAGEPGATHATSDVGDFLESQTADFTAEDLSLELDEQASRGRQSPGPGAHS